MSAAASIEAPTSKWDLIQAEPARALTEPTTFRDVLSAMKGEIEAFRPDMSSAKGRQAIKALAFKITRTKTAIDDAGKKLNEDHRAAINAVDAKRREVKAALEALSEEVRRPLTEWEEAEEARMARVNAFFADIKERIGQTAGTSEQLSRRLDDLRSIEIAPDVFGDRFDEATAARDSAQVALENALSAELQAEADRAELARLRKAEADRLAKEEAEAKERARVEREAKAEEERKAQAERAAAEQKAREEAAAAQAEERARQAAEDRAREEREKVEREHQAALAAEKRRADDAEAARKAEADRIAKAEADQAAEAKRIADEKTAREADHAHRGAIMGAAKKAIMEHGGVSEKAAKAIVLAIVAGSVPHTTLAF